MIKNIPVFFSRLLKHTLVFITPVILIMRTSAVLAQQNAEQGETVQQVRYWSEIGFAIRDFIFIVMFIAGIVIFAISIGILMKDYVMADASRGDKKFSIGELFLGVFLAGALMSPFGLLSLGTDAAGGANNGERLESELFDAAKDNQQGPVGGG